MPTLETDLSTTRQWLDVSLAQRAVWLDASLNTSADAYTLVRWARLRGEMDADVARQALTLIVARHDGLRLRVDTELPRQWLHPHSDAPFRVVDLSNEADPEQALNRHLKQSVSAGIPLGDHWLFSLEVLKLGPGDYFLLVRCHHLIADEAAVSMIMAHLLEAYRALSSDSAGELTQPSSYVSVIASDTAYSESSRHQQDLEYWVRRFKSLSPPLIETGTSTMREGPPIVQEWLLEGDPLSAFVTACAEAGVTIQRAIFSLISMVLGRRYNRHDLTIGMALHRRDISNLHVVGMMAGMIPVRCQMKEGATLSDTVKEISAQVDRDLRHQRLPIDALSRELGISRGGLSEIFQVAFSFLPSMRGASDVVLDGIDIQLGGIPSREASPISFHASELGGKRGISFDLSAHPGFIEEAEADRILELFQTCLQQFISDPDSEIETLPGLTNAEHTLVTSEWNATTASYPNGRAEWFFQQRALETPDALGVVSASDSLTYRELDVRSSQLANLLLERGCLPQSVVGVALKRSAATVVSLLAILKAGCTYLPLDPSYPPDRLAHMVDDSGAALALTSDDISSLLPHHLPRIFVNQPGLLTCQVESATAPQLSADEAAYIIYTSGSTGKPKGVAVPHSAAVNLAFGRLVHDPIGAGDRILAAISVGFDVSIGQLLLPLLTGATIVIAGDLRTLTPQEFWKFIGDHNVTHINSVPSFFESILEAAPKSASLQRLMLGGEPLSSTLVKRLKKALPATQVFNMYGPTEACIDATVYAATSNETAPVLPIGKALPNYRAYILNEYLEPVGIGISGDLYLAGAGLAHAYINQPALTAERFIADPFGVSGARLYRTGDRARWRTDGNLEFLGRADTQVKIRGHRIELGEIEAALLLHPAVAQTAVIASTNARLVAYVVLNASTATSGAAQFRSHLATHVPEYMIPSAFVTLPALPLTPNGKLDQRALPPVDWKSERSHVAPRTETERQVAAAFAELLGVAEVGATDNFFELGGHSLLAARLVSQLRTRLNASISLRAIFERPTVEAIAGHLDAATQSAGVDFVPLERPEVLPLSYTQERLWFLTELQKDDSYNVPLAVSFRGVLDVGRAAAALKEVVSRHEALRTLVVMHGDQPVQKIQAAEHFQVEVVHLSQPDVVQQRISNLASFRFDLASHLPIKAEIITVDVHHHVLAAVIHHSVFDGWSASLFFREFAQAYAAISMPDLPIQYADFAVWQREQDFAQDIDYWKAKLAGAPPYLDFPATGTFADLSKRRAGVVPLTIDAKLHDALSQIANLHGASMFMVLHAAFAALLAHWSGQRDIVIGTVVANRVHAEFEPLIGCFVNTLALRTTLNGAETFLQLLESVRNDDLAAYEHQGVPFEKLVDELQPERSLSHTPIFQVMLVMQNEEPPVETLAGLNVEPWPIEPGVAKFNLTLNLGQTGGSLEYASDLYDVSSMARFAEQFQRMLAMVAADPEIVPLRADLLAPVERAQVVLDWNATDTEYPIGRAEHFVQQQALQIPDAIAVVSVKETLTYRQLDDRSNQLANLLVEHCAPKSVVGVALQRSIDTVVSLLAIIKAGCVYLPLDPSYPRDRLAHMLSDSGASLVITNEAASGSLPNSINRVFIDQLDLLQGKSEFAPFQNCGVDDTAYIIYTSGSTGKPKGVAVPHAAAVNLAFGRLLHDPIGAGDRILAAISVGFDVSIGQLLLPLLSGATIVIAGDLRTMTPLEFWEFIGKNGVTHINSVPSFFESILDAAPRWTPLQRLMLGGEPLSSTLVKRLKRALPATQVFNMYGPTEACIDATVYPTTDHETAAVLPIGKPLPNYRVYILNDYLQPVGTGISGDLYLAGKGLAHAYINQPALTAECFIANPFGKPGERLYRTGDRARWRTDGNIDFLGRADTQVKIRGHRIELGEIESALLQQPGVREVAVIVREETPGDQRLVAYYVAAQPLSSDDLQAALRKSLPAYMVPAAYVQLESLPLTPNGKLDRKALPVPGTEAFAKRQFEAPEGAAEQQIAEILSAVLKVSQVGRNDNFFELGGHSLLAMTVIERMRQAGLHADVRHLFTSPTVAGLAAACGVASQQVNVPPNLIPADAASITPQMLPLVQLSQSEIDSIASAIPGGTANIQDIYPLAPLQEGILFHHRMSTTGDAYLTPFIFGFASRHQLDLFVDSLGQLIIRHDILRTAVLWENLPEPLQVVLRQAPLQVAEESPAEQDAPSYLRQKYDPQHFRIDVRTAPMMRAVVSQDVVNNRWLLLVMSHHLILDHTSMEVVLHEIAAISSGRAAALPEPAQFRNFVAQTRLGISQQEHEEFFRKMLADVDETTAPFGVLHVQGDGAGIREATVTLEAALANRLRSRARELGVGPAAIFHLAWAIVLGHVSGREDVVFGTLLLGRLQSAQGLQNALGLFINTLPLRIRINSANVPSAIQATHSKLAELIRHENASLALAQRCSGVPAPAPLFSSLFNFRQTPRASNGNVIPGVELVFGQERTDYPVAVAIDDRTDDFLITAQSDAPVNPADLCSYLETALHGLLAAIETDPLRAVSQISVTSQQQRELVIKTFNQTTVDYPSGTLEDFFQRQVSESPDNLAIDDGPHSRTYRELDEISNRLADVLIARGIVPQSVVGVALPRSSATVVCFIAILKAGAVYLPLDPAYPPDRLAFMIADSGAQLVIGNSETSSLLPSGIAALDLDLSESAPESPRPFVHPNSTAYIIYTSGSTGKPKGVAVPHSAAVNLAFARQPHDPIRTGDRILAAISVGFDVSIGQLLLPLLSGATIVIASDLRTLTPKEFWDFLQTHGVTHINSVPSFFESVLDAAPASAILKRLMLGGEPLTSSLVRRLQKALPKTQFFNMYGPTEACIDATVQPADGLETSVVLPVGKPLPNYRAYILNSRLEPVGIGVEGDLYLAGSGLAHSYINQPALTAEQFIADPFGNAGGRIYKTGDRARWRYDGVIDFLGRADSQVKIRGHRIELGEIEAALLLQPGVQESAVIVREDMPGDQRLVAYYTAQDELSADNFRAALSQSLPSYMVPAAYVHLASLPLTPNGKLNRKALPVPGVGAYIARQFEPPQTAAEQQIADIFAAVLKVKQVGRHDNFFELGGHSLLAMTVIDRMRQAGLHVDVRHLFTSPTVSGLAMALTSASDQILIPPNLIPTAATTITPEMLPLVALTQSQINGIANHVPGGFANIQDIYPLAPLQEGILFHHLMSETGDAYLTPFIFGFDHRNRLDSFIDVLSHLVARHDILRTAVLWDGVPEPVQIVLREARLPVTELIAASDADAVAQLLERFDPRHFRIDLRQAPLMHAYIMQDMPRNRWLLMVMSHHLILDHTSMEVILHEASLLSFGQQNSLPPATPFRNFVAQARLGISKQEHEDFFRGLLADVTETTAPYGLLHVQGDGAGIRESRITIQSATAKRLRTRARALGVSPATLFHLAWAVVLAHISGRRDVVFGTLLLGRMQSGDAQRTLGLFINTLPLRIKIDSAGVEAAVRRTNRQLAELIRHENASLALAQRCSGVPAPAPLFSSLFNFRQSPPAAAGNPTIPGAELVFAQERTDYPVAVAIDDQLDDFLITAQSDTPVDPADLCQYLHTAVMSLLAMLDISPNSPVHQISVLPEDKLHQLTVFNSAPVAYPTGTIHESFERQALRTPDAIAVTSVGETLTYAELHQEAQDLAGTLASQGVTAEQVVGVLLPRSTSTVIAALAILKLGAIYLPLDPAYPPQRLAYMIADSGCNTVLVSAATESLAPAFVNSLNVDLADNAVLRPHHTVTSANTAYIIYTSGSTGKPKGVAVPHSAAVNLAFSRLEHDPITTGDRILAAISVGFDVSIGQLLLPLLNGATVVIASDLRTLTPQEFWDFLATNRVTHINSVPSFFESILDAAPTSTTLVRLMLGGEPLTPSLVRRLAKSLPNTQVVNMYGPTEACIDATCYPASIADTAPVLPIGKPLPNYQAYILNDLLDPVGTGAEGDLYLGGAGLAHAYINQPALTAERFIANPFQTGGERIYKTGDRARWRTDGNIEFLGRADTQVKIRGHRIELGEIEAALLTSPSVARSVVVAHAQRLIAYIVLNTGENSLDADALRLHLTTHLPEYMIPAQFITLPSLPLTANGKVDLKALPRPSFEQSMSAAYEPPTSETEIAMHALWSQVLEVDRIGIHDDFFALGGHSLAVMRLISLCNGAFKTTLTLRALFENPTIARLSRLIDNGATATGHPALVPLRHGQAHAPLFCVHPAGGAVFPYIPLAFALTVDLPVYGLQARSLQEGEPFGASIENMASDYVAAIRSVQPHGPYRLLGWSSGGMLAYEMAQQLSKLGEAVSFLALFDTSLPDNQKDHTTEQELVRQFAYNINCEDLLPALTGDQLIDKISDAGRIPPGISLAQMKRFYLEFCNTVIIYPRYRPALWNGPFLYFRALKRETAVSDWSTLVEPSATFVNLDCTHNDFPTEPVVFLLLKHIEPLLT